MTNTKQGLAGGPQTLRKEETTKKDRRGIAEGSPTGRTIVMTDGLHVALEMLAAGRRGQRVTGWEYDQPNDTAYIYTVPAVDGRRPLSPMGKLAAWFCGRRGLRAGMVQKGGAA